MKVILAECWRQSTDKADADDISQCILIQMWHSWEAIENPVAYAQRAASYQIRRLRARHRTEIQLFPYEIRPDQLTVMQPTNAQKLSLREGLNRLSSDLRAIVMRHLIACEPLRKIASELNMSKSEIHRKYHIALEDLKRNCSR